MRLYLVQHGEAVPKGDNAERPLADKGRQDVERVAVFLKQAGAEVSQIRHSGKRRAEETAAILAKHLVPPGGVSPLPGLEPDDDVERAAERIKREAKPLMLVGHQPFMGRLAGLLLAGDRDAAVVRFRKGGVVCLERDPTSSAWSVAWAVTPDLIP